MISLDIAKSRMVSLEFQKANTLKGATGMAESNTFKKRISAETIQKIMILAGCIFVGAIFKSSEGNLFIGALLGFPLYWTVRLVIKMFGGRF